MNNNHNKKKNGLFHIFSKTIVLLTYFSIIFPILIMTIWSFSKKWVYPNLFPSGFTLRGYSEIFGGYSGAISALFSSIVIALVVGILSALIGVLTSRSLVLYDFKGKGLMKFFTILPFMIPSTAFAMGIQYFFIKLGINDSIFGVIIVHVICAMPYSISILTSVTGVHNVEMEEQAMLFGASKSKAFFYTSLPILAPAIISAICMGYIVSFGQYFLTLIIGGGTVKTFAIFMMPYIIKSDRTVASAYCLVFTLSTFLVFSIVEFVSLKFLKVKPITFIS